MRSKNITTKKYNTFLLSGEDQIEPTTCYLIQKKNGHLFGEVKVTLFTNMD